MKLAQNFEELIKAFNRCKVDYMIVGGYAVIFHGYGRTTGDLDIWLHATNENKTRLIKSFKEMHFGENEIKLLESLDFSKPFSFKVGIEPLVVDVLNSISGIDYSEAIKNAIPYQFANNVEVRFIHLHDLVQNKMIAGRMKDLADVEELQKIHLFTEDKNFFQKIMDFFKRK